MKYIKINILIICLLFGLIVQAQRAEKKTANKVISTNQIKGLKIGDRIPDIPLDKIVEVDGTLKSANTADFNDRLLILDFMYTTCSSCVAGLPKKDKLQKQFGDKVKIMVVVGGEAYAPGMLKRENTAFIKQYLTNTKSFLFRNKVEIPWVVENKMLNLYFPHYLVSHLVWIYKGKLVAVTEQDYVNAENIRHILEGKKSNMPIKNDFLPAVDVKTPLVLQNRSRFTGDRPTAKYTAVFGPYQDGVYTKSGAVRDSLNHSRRDYIINLPIVNVYISRWMMAGRTSPPPNPSQIILEVKDSSRYVEQEDSKEYNYIKRQKMRICYEAVGPDTGQTIQQIARAVIADLDHLLNLYGRYEKRRLKCLILYRTDVAEKFKSNSTNGENWANLNVPEIKLHNMELSNLVWKMNQFYGNPPVFDETGYTGNIDMEFKLGSWQDIPAVREALQSYGLDLKEEERELEVFVLTEKDKGSQAQSNNLYGQ